MNYKFFYGLLMLLSLMSTTCLSSDDDLNIDNSIEINQIKEHVQSGSWRITSMIDSGTDKTSRYLNYNFMFNKNGTLTANNGNAVLNGTWSITNSGSNDDSSDDIDFNIFFASPENFNDNLSEDWDIVSHTNTKIELIHISGGNGGTDNLVFEKN